MNHQNSSNRAGSLNPEFGGGHVTLNHTGSDALLVAMEPTGDGGLLVLSKRPGVGGFFVSKFTPAGELDTGFATGKGFFQETNTGGGSGLHLLDEGRFLVTGGQGNDLLSRCYAADGSLYTPYGENGYARVPVTELVVRDQRRAHWHWTQNDDTAVQDAQGLPGKSSGDVISLADRGAVYLVFNAWWGEYETLMAVVVRVDAEGKLDMAFNQTGYFVVTMAGTGVEYNFARRAALQPSINPDGSGVVLLVYEALPREQPGGRAYLLRVTAHGVDFEFGKSSPLQGYVEAPGRDKFVDYDMWADDESFRIMGTSIRADVIPATVYGYTADGEVDRSFNNGAPLWTEFQPGTNVWNHGYFYGEDADRRMVFTTLLSSDGGQVAAVRLLANGEGDSSFGDNGFVTFPAQLSGWLASTSLRVTETPTKDVLIGFKEDIYWLLGE